MSKVVVLLTSFATSVVCGAAAEGQDLASRLSSDQGSWRAINADSQTIDSKPCYTVLPDGSMWIAWHGYRSRSDRILARQVRPDGLGAIERLSEHDTAHDGPVMAAVGADQLQVCWSSLHEGRWQITGRRFTGDAWQRAVMLSDDGADAIQPAMTSLGDGRALIAYAAHDGQQFQIRYRVLQEDQWTEPATASDDGYDAQRPAVVAAADGRAWVAWDAYENNNHAVYVRQVLPRLGATERITPAGQNCLMPVLNTTDSELAVAWLKTTDVSNGAGVIDQINTLHMALTNDGKWREVRDPDGGDVGATLVHGITPRMHPRPTGKWGHMAPLRGARLLAEGDTVWLLWERKTRDNDEPADALADLAARPCRDGKWGPSVILTSGLIDYHLAAPARTDNGEFRVVASQLPRGQRREYHLLTCDTNDQLPFQQDEWLGWKPIKLPLNEPPLLRHEIKVDEQTYRLYWIDLHNHSALTCDCEGEPDEMFRYGRDRARIDGMALTDNDEIFDDPLTEGEYAYGTFMARCFNEPGRFATLLSYEWTSYLPDSPEVDRADPRNWDVNWFGRNGHPNHRTVIYPLSGGPLVNHTEVGNNIELMLDTVHKFGGVAFAHHPSWDEPSHPAEVGCEVTSAWSISFNAPLIHGVLEGGHRLGFAGHSDAHRRNPGLAGGLTAVYAPELTSEAILAALHDRRFYATNGSRIVVDSRANGTLFGQETEARDGVVEIRLHVIGTRPIVSAELVHNGESVKTYQGNGQEELRAVFRSPQLPPGRHWYYWKIVQEGSSRHFPGSSAVARGHLAWCTPHWVTVPPSR
ncbi:DUF3604 domain-containing protein [Pirellulales bacterium]|nr:DUF3604 domain-containing protein [Pirellulales bacterium]